MMILITNPIARLYYNLSVMVCFLGGITLSVTQYIEPFPISCSVACHLYPGYESGPYKQTCTAGQCVCLSDKPEPHFRLFSQTEITMLVCLLKQWPTGKVSYLLSQSSKLTSQVTALLLLQKTLSIHGLFKCSDPDCY